MTTLLSKVWYDLWQAKGRTMQVVLVIALGAIGIAAPGPTALLSAGALVLTPVGLYVAAALRSR